MSDVRKRAQRYGWIKKIVKGYFNLHLKGKSPDYPGDLAFETGEFEVKMME